MRFIAILLLMLGLSVNAVSLFANYNYITLQTQHVSFLSSLILTAFALALGIAQILVPFALPVLQKMRSYFLWLAFAAVWGCAVVYSAFSTTGMIETLTVSIRNNSAGLVELQKTISELESQIASNKAQLDPKQNPTYSDLTQKQKNRLTNDNGYLSSQLTKARNDKKKEIESNKDASTSDNLFVVYADKYKAYGAALFELISFIFVYGANLILLNVRQQNAPQAVRKTSKKEAEKSTISDAAADSRSQAAASFEDHLAANLTAKNDNATDSREIIRKLSAGELAAMLKANNDESLSYSKITAKYGVKNKDTIRDSKALLAQEQGQAKDVQTASMLKNDIPSSNIILLPNYK